MRDFDPDRYVRLVQREETLRMRGRVRKVIGTVIEGTLPDCSIGQLCEIDPGDGREPIRAEVVGFREERVLIMPLGEIRGLKPGCIIRTLRATPTVPVGPDLLGRVMNGLGEPIDGGPPPHHEQVYPIYTDPVNAFDRQRIREPLDLGVRAVNGLLTCGVGQRIGIMAGSGVGKSTLLGMYARQTRADVNVIGLIGERGRELKEFIERDLGHQGLARSVVITATSDRSPLERVRAAFVATAVAEYFRDQGNNVLLMMDSVTRFALAQREIGLSIGEPPTTRGYPPSVFSLLPKLLERAGMGSSQMGGITGLYTVLVDGDDMNEPVADAIRAILDGHIVLSRDLADRGHYPAIDVLASKSRLMPELISERHQQAAVEVLSLIAAYRRVETLINIGAYVAGSDPTVDRAIQMRAAIQEYLRQGVLESSSLEESIAGLNRLLRKAHEDCSQNQAASEQQPRPRRSPQQAPPQGPSRDFEHTKGFQPSMP